MIVSDFYTGRPVVWHVVFHEAEGWWPGRFKHVSMAGFVGNTWVHYDLHRGRTTITALYEFEEVRDYLSFLLTHYTVVRVDTLPPKRRWGMFLFPMSCVSAACHILGVRALLPDGLFKTLLKSNGAVLLNETENSARDT